MVMEALDSIFGDLHWYVQVAKLTADPQTTLGSVFFILCAW